MPLPPPPPPPPPSTLPQLQTTRDFAPNELLKEMGFDISPTTTSSNSTVSPTTLTTTMDKKKYDLNICLFHLINLELFQAISNGEWYVKCPFSRECGVFAHRTMQNATWVYSTEKDTKPTGILKELSCVNATARLP